MPDRISQLQREYTDKYVVVDPGRAELARFKGQTGRIKSVNMSGRALVQFDANANIGWYDIEIDHLRVVDPPAAKPEKADHKAAAPAPAKAAPAKAAAAPPKAAPTKGAQAAPTAPGEKKLSPLELARMQGAAKKGAEAAGPAPAKAVSAAPVAGEGSQSTAEILAAARRPKQPSAPPPESKPAQKPAGKAKLNVAEVLAAARGKAAPAPGALADRPAAASPPTPKSASPPAQKPASPAGPKGRPSVSEVLAAARGGTAAAAPAAQADAANPTVESAAAPEPADTAAAPTAAAKGSQAGGALPTTTAERLAWCRSADAKK